MNTCTNNSIFANKLNKAVISFSMKKESLISIAQRTISLEAESIHKLRSFIDNDFEQTVHKIADCEGRLIISGIGKSAIIAQKIVATLNSTGTASIFMHAADAIHGDLGMVQPNDILLIISKSGDSPEIKVLVSLIKNFGNTLVGMVGNLNSFLAANSHFILNTTVDQEACPNNLAPTSSTTAQLVMGDALAVCLMEIKGFKTDDFAKFHPGGTLGKKLFLRVNELSDKNEKPVVQSSANIKEVIVEMTKKRLGATVVLNEQHAIAGIITDGDLRRMLEKEDSFSHLTAKDIMTKNPQIIESDALATAALTLMQEKNISQLIVEKEGHYLGLIHLHDLVKEGII